jgi:O-antigen/teichoic acid export membrane protein
MVPMYVRYMGIEAYGLVGFFGMLQAWFQLLDLGLTPTMARETARFRGGATGGDSLRRLLRALEVVFVVVAITGCVFIVCGADGIASKWLKVERLPLDEVRRSIILMAAIVALRWVSGLYRGAINGFERLVWLSSFNMVIATARFVLVLPFFAFVGSSPTDFFGYQLVIALIEFAALVFETYRLLPSGGSRARWSEQWHELKNVLRFSLSIAFTSSVWVFVTQTDKLVLSKVLPLAEYAHFTLAVLVASGVSVISGPISGALLPRLTKLAAEQDDSNLVGLYRKATQLVCAIAVPAALVLAFFPYQVLWAWTGDPEIAHAAAPVLRLYALGNGVLALGAFPYYLQFAKGDLKLHLIGNGLFVFLLIPSVLAAASRYGMVGAGYSWLVANVIYFLFWVPLVHKRLAPGLHAKWLLHDVGAPAVVATVFASIIGVVITWPENRMLVGIEIGVVSLVLLTLALFSSRDVRTRALGLNTAG